MMKGPGMAPKGKMADLNINMDAGHNNYSTSIGGMPLNLNESSHGDLYMPSFDMSKAPKPTNTLITEQSA